MIDKTGVTAWALLVVSSEQQAETLVHQRVWAERTADEHGWQLTRCLEGVSSGRDGARRLSQRLVAEVRDAPVEVRPQRVLMIRLDRVGRGSIIEAQLVVRDLRILGATVFTRDQGEIKLDSAMDELIAAVQLAVGRHENEVRREKATAVFRRKREAGLVAAARAPYGLAIVAGCYQRVAGQAECMEEAFRMRAAGRTLHEICRWLDAHAPPRAYKSGRIVPPLWTSPAIHRMFKNVAYRGNLVDEALFARAAHVRRYVSRPAATHRKTRGFPLTGSVRCHCGHPLRGRAMKKARYAYYVCQAHWNHDGSSVCYQAEPLEAEYLLFLAHLKDDPRFALESRSYSSYGRRTAQITKRLSLLSERRDRLECARKRAWSLESMGRLTVDDLERRLADIATQLVHLDRTASALREELVLIEASARDVERTRDILVSAWAAYADAEWMDQRVIAREIATALGGIHWRKNAFRIGQSPERFRRRRANVNERY